MTDIRDAEPQPPDDSGGYCCVSAGMHEGHDEDCPLARPCPNCGGSGDVLLPGQDYIIDPRMGCVCARCKGQGTVWEPRP